MGKRRTRQTRRVTREPGRPCLRAAEVAALLDISLGTLWRWVKLGAMPAPFRLGPMTVVWDRNEVLDFRETARSPHSNPTGANVRTVAYAREVRAKRLRRAG